MNSIQILDCTLRDGGYINNWRFGSKVIKTIMKYLNESHVDIVECGFLSEGEYDPDRTIFNQVSQIKELIPEYGVKYVAMIALGEKEIDYKKVPVCDGESIWGIRLTFHKHEIERAFVYARDLMAKGYKVFIQPVGTCTYKDRELLDLVNMVNSLNPYAFYIVDTLGTITGTELMRIFQMIDVNLNPQICIGFHSHNNLQLSFSNAQKLVHHFSERNTIIDASVQGMGRGAGNLCTELIAQYLNEKIHSSYDVIPLLEIIDRYLNNIKEETPWGYAIPYYISAVNNCHPNYASFLMNRQTLRVKDIKRILDKLPLDKRALFDKEQIKEIYEQYMECLIDDKESVKELTQELDGKKILVIAPGSSISKEKEIIDSYIKENNPVIITVNFVSDYYDADYIFVSNMKRFDDIDFSVVDKWHNKVIVTSNINIVESANVIKINYASYTNSDYIVSDNAGLMLLHLLRSCKAQKIALAGFDGFVPYAKQNYFSEELLNSVEYAELETKTVHIREYINQLKKEMDINFVTKSQYEVK